MVLFIPQDIYHVDVAGKFFLVAMPALVAASAGSACISDVDHRIRHRRVA
ncbi:hypothetical protein [Mycobacterium sp.]|nr:hypothetical protein [Mycobacterium sp.]